MIFLLCLLLLLVAVAFYTLLERKVLAYIMLRRGPNKPSFSGLLVPFADAVKLLTKPFIFPSSSRYSLIVFSCLLSFLIPSVLWTQASLYSRLSFFQFSIFVLLVWISLSIYSLLAAGLGSNSKYSTLGGLRSIAQCISYEVRLSFLFLNFSLLFGFNFFRAHLPSVFLCLLHLSAIAFVILLAETNRSPFDFAEGESELVSGYNVDFSGSGFVVLFLSEYLSILFIRALIRAITFTGSYFCTLLGSVFFAFLFLWVRGSLPRFRYDQLILLS